MSDKLTIEQRHRDAYAREVETMDPEYAGRIRAGQRDTLTMVRAFARFEADYLRTPTPGEVEDAAKRIAEAAGATWPHDANRYRKYAAAALRSTPPAQPTADAVERLRPTVERAFSRRSLGSLLEDEDVFLACADAILAALPTMTGDYVMVPRVPTDAMLKAWFDTRRPKHVHGNERYYACYEAMIAASPTGGE